jgi:type I restriction enzyme S subunit
MSTADLRVMPKATNGPRGRAAPAYKRTELGLFPSDWSLVPLGDLLAFQNGVNADRGSYGRGVPFANVLEVITHTHLLAELIPGRVSLRKTQEESYAVRPGDILFNRTSETQEEVGLASVYIGAEAVAFGGFVIRGRPTSAALDQRYAAWGLRAPAVRSQIIARGQGAIRANIGQADLRTVLVPLPPLIEQQAIADALSDADALIESLEQLVTKKRAIKQGAMRELLTGERRLPGFHKPWVVRAIGDDVTTLESGVSVNSVETDVSPTIGPAILRTSCISRGVFNPRECKAIMGREADRARLNPLRDTVLISRMNTPHLVGECGYVDRDYHDLFLPDRLWMTGFRKGAALSARWLSFVLSLERFRSLLKAIATGTSGSMKNISKESFLSLKLDVPSRHEQVAIVATLDDMGDGIDGLEAKLEKARQVKQGMMQELLTGRIRLI